MLVHGRTPEIRRDLTRVRFPPNSGHRGSVGERLLLTQNGHRDSLAKLTQGRLLAAINGQSYAASSPHRSLFRIFRGTSVRPFEVLVKSLIRY